jgi:hypothetical protein
MTEADALVPAGSYNLWYQLWKAMPTVRIGGFLCYFVSYDCVEPPHIHLARGKDRSAPSVKFWLEPARLEKNRGLTSGQLREARRIVLANQALFLDMWNEYCND